MNYTESNPQRWYKAQSHRWHSGSISSYGAFSEYDPFKTPVDLYRDFLLLMRKVDAYRKAFLIIGASDARRNMHEYGVKRKDFETFKAEMMEQYITFADRWGLLGIGFSRIIDTAHIGCRSRGNNGSRSNNGSRGRNEREIIHEQGKVKRLMLNETETVFDLNLPELNKAKALKFNRFKTINPDSLPVSGGAVPLSVWEKDYTSMDMRKYSEKYDALAGCRELLGIWSDIKFPTDDGEITFHPTAVTVTGKSITWQFNSLIQAIQTIHMLNKVSQLTDSWEICRECISMFRLRDKYQRKFCSDTCRNTAKMRKYRAKKKTLPT